MTSSKENNVKVVFAGAYNTGEVLTGPEKVCKRIFAEYSKKHSTVFIDYFRDGSKYGLIRKLFGFEKVDEINGSPVFRMGIFRMIAKLFIANPGIIHILSFERFAVFVFILKLITRVKIYYNVNGIIKHENKYFNKENYRTVFLNSVVESVLMNLSDIVFHLSERSKFLILSYYHINKLKLKPVRNGLDEYFLRSEKKNNSKDINSIVFIGDISRKEKGAGFLIDALSLIEYRLKLYVVSDDKNIQGTKTGNSSEIIFVERLNPSGLIDFLKDKNIIAAPGMYDQFNIAVLEAVSCGLYPVITKQTGVSEFIGEFTKCSIVEYGDTKALASAIEYILKNKVSIDSFPNLSKLSWENVFRDYYSIYY